MSRFSLGVIFWLIVTCLGLSSLPLQADEPIIIAVNEDILPDYHRFLNNRAPLSIHEYKGNGARRDVVELVLLMQALKLGGFKPEVELRAEQSYLRTLRDIAEGRFITSAGLAWKADIDALPHAYFTSRPLIKQGEFTVGLYTSLNNQKAFNSITPKLLMELNVVTNSQWKSDVQTLKDLGFKQISYSPNWVNMARMIEANRADITLAPFQSTPNMSVAVGDVTLYPIKDIKVAISGSRHWPVSRKHPQGETFYRALERGLAQLDAKGIIHKAYRECGFFHPEVRNWKLLEPQQ